MLNKKGRKRKEKKKRRRRNKKGRKNFGVEEGERMQVSVTGSIWQKKKK